MTRLNVYKKYDKIVILLVISYYIEIKYELRLSTFHSSVFDNFISISLLTNHYFSFK